MKIGTTIAAMCAAALVAGCGDRINTSNPQAYQSSVTKMMADMTSEQKVKFTEAMTAIAFDTSDVSPNAFVGDPSSVIFLGGAGEKIKGKTADQIIRLGYETRIAKLNDEILVGMQTVQAAKAERDRHKATFDSIRIEGVRFYVQRNYIVEPVIEFRITNGSNIVLRQGFFQGTLTSPGRSVPWVDEAFNHEFSGGLEPGESRLLQLSPNMFGEWGQGDHINRKDLQLAVRLINVEDSNGTKLLTGQPDDPAALERELTAKQAEKTKLERELAAL